MDQPIKPNPDKPVYGFKADDGSLTCQGCIPITEKMKTARFRPAPFDPRAGEFSDCANCGELIDFVADLETPE